jgi:transcriptional regulator with XRE-family HTH domain/DNA-binding transcriptional regulator YiaG
MNPPPPNWEAQIGQRLRIFREAKSIPRTAFALSVGIGSERLASYESGRVPLRFEVFQAIHRKYFLNPVWLATGQEPRECEAPIDWGKLISGIPPRYLFSVAYVRALERICKDPNRMVEAVCARLEENLSRLMGVAKEARKIKVSPESTLRIKQRLGDLDTALKEFSILGLTGKSENRKCLAVILPTISELLDRTRKIVKPPGMKTVLASYLGVPRSRLSEWLGRKYEPSGEMALRLLKWVSTPALQQNAPGSVTSTAKGKATRRKARHEIKPSSDRKKQ